MTFKPVDVNVIEDWPSDQVFTRIVLNDEADNYERQLKGGVLFFVLGVKEAREYHKKLGEALKRWQDIDDDYAAYVEADKALQEQLRNATFVEELDIPVYDPNNHTKVTEVGIFVDKYTEMTKVATVTFKEPIRLNSGETLTIQWEGEMF